MDYYMLSNQEYKNYVMAFKAWLRVQNYSGTTLKNYPVALREFFFHLEKNNITSIDQIDQKIMDNYAEWILIRPNQKYGGALSIGQVNRHYGVLMKFREYIEKAENRVLPYELKSLKRERNAEVDYLSEQEIKALYDATDETPHGYRDRAMLSIYYGCGLRRQEGIDLDVDDLYIDRKLLLATKTKNSHERFVPVTPKHLQYITQYIETARPLFLSLGSKETALLVSERGSRIGAQQMYNRIQRLANLAGIGKNVGVHTLRHSVATHLLARGMELENVALFLGHLTLDSTQVYTHVLNQNPYTL